MIVGTGDGDDQILNQSTLFVVTACRCDAVVIGDADLVGRFDRLTRGQVLRECVVDGDAYLPLISAASIIAKVERDRMMTALCTEHPGYGFARHKGYGTPEHQAALKSLGPCAIHRRSFKPVQLAMELKLAG